MKSSLCLPLQAKLSLQILLICVSGLGKARNTAGNDLLHHQLLDHWLKKVMQIDSHLETKTASIGAILISLQSMIADSPAAFPKADFFHQTGTFQLFFPYPFFKYQVQCCKATDKMTAETKVSWCASPPPLFLQVCNFRRDVQGLSFKHLPCRAWLLNLLITKLF